jgi:hypothetical protein
MIDTYRRFYDVVFVVVGEHQMMCENGRFCSPPQLKFLRTKSIDAIPIILLNGAIISSSLISLDTNAPTLSACTGQNRVALWPAHTKSRKMKKEKKKPLKKCISYRGASII